MNPVGRESPDTQRRAILGIEAELEAEGFENAELIGSGGFGAVYRCVERALQRPVAVKVLRSGAGTADLERFLREQHTMGRLAQHPNIVTVLQVDVTATGQPYLVMPYCVRGSLHDAISRSGPLDYAVALRYAVKLAGALETAHRHGILHRDVKPANVLINDYGEPQLCDFGIAHVTGGFETGTGQITGSPAFTAPEVLLGRTSTIRSDVYSLGATLFSAVSGYAAFERKEGEDIVAQFVRLTRQPADRPPELPGDIGALIARAMAESPENRPTAEEFGDWFRELQRGKGLAVDGMSIGPSLERTESPPTRPPPPSIVAFPTPNTRFRPPRMPRDLVPRPRLTAMLDQAARKRLTLIHAPAGFGKSCVATQLAERLFDSGVRVAWLAIDADDNNVVTFCAHLVEALHRVDPSLGEELRLTLEEAGGLAERFVLTSLINEIHQHKQQMAVVIDDWHLVTSEPTRAALRFLLDKACHHLQLVVATRTKAGFPLGTLRVHDELLEIDSTALRFTIDEAQEFLSRPDGITLGRDDVARLTESTEGWVAALQLATLSMRRRHPEAGELLSGLSGRHQAIGEFLAENVLDTLEPAVVEFMMCTSITERVCGDLADALTGTGTGRSLLETVEERNLFLRRVDEDGEWFRYHPLFADYLRRRLERERPEHILTLHRTAAEWFALHGMTGDAVTHALAAGDGEWAAELVESTGFELLEKGQMASLLALVEALPADVAASRPQLQITVALADIALRRDVAAREALNRVYAVLDETAESAAVGDLRARCRVIEGVGAMLTDRTEGVRELVTGPLASPDSFDPWCVTAAAAVSAYLDIADGEFDEAKARRERAAAYFDNSAGPMTQTYSYCLSAIAAREQLDLRATEYYLNKAMRIAMNGRKTHGPAARLVGALLGDLRYEQNDLAEAERLLDGAFELGAMLGTVDFMIATYVTGAKVKAALGDREEAIRRLDAGMQVAIESDLSRLAASIVDERVRLGMPDGSADLSSDTDAPSGTANLTREIQRRTSIRRRLAARSPSAADSTADMARALVTRLSAQHRTHTALTAKLLLAEALSMSGDDLQAQQIAADTATRCAQIGLIRPILDAGPVISALLDRTGSPTAILDAIARERELRRSP